MSKVILMVILTSIVISTAGCDQYKKWADEEKVEADKLRAIDEIKRAVLKVLIDPDSAKFGEVFIEGSSHLVNNYHIEDNFYRACITVNSKNSMGGYSGNQQAMAFVNQHQQWEVVYIHNHDLATCRTFLPMQYPEDKYGLNKP